MTTSQHTRQNLETFCNSQRWGPGCAIDRGNNIRSCTPRCPAWLLGDITIFHLEQLLRFFHRKAALARLIRAHTAHDLVDLPAPALPSNLIIPWSWASPVTICNIRNDRILARKKGVLLAATNLEPGSLRLSWCSNGCAHPVNPFRAYLKNQHSPSATGEQHFKNGVQLYGHTTQQCVELPLCVASQWNF